MGDLQIELLRVGLTTPEQLEQVRSEQRRKEQRERNEKTQRMLHPKFQKASPLRLDNCSRGQYAVHVKRHRKMGVHCTLTKSSLPFINAVIVLPEIEKIVFGRVIIASARGGPAGVWLRRDDNWLRLAVGDNRSLQTFVIHLRMRDQRSLQIIIEALQSVAEQLSVPLELIGLP